MRTLLIIPALWLAMADKSLPTSEVRVPMIHPAVMVDGVLSHGEWERAAVVEVPKAAKLYFQRSKDFVYIAVEYTQAPSGIVDLFVSDHEGEIYDLHASAKLGERRVTGGEPPEWNWWNNREWTANVSRVDSFAERSFLPAPIREYQIRRSRFPAQDWRLRFELTAMAGKQIQSVTIFPEGAGDHSTSGWLVLHLK